ncbi:helix-turn-helix domain-containing protein [Pseudoalteromonas fuliginea]|uniref:XRE family transcriptional regulator n=1 Tax=Pseudoalteromonas fuliginea TaxID=1872678 RepID=A0ABQ6RMV6_9GAMM|nr:helix-turn-helix transcriptional regulator [Pseudoalteromonas fuliginea]KAA1165392.1 XRE family transcriptional regulator [Pseudoalteromonas fuliginea]KAA1169491.1 XRE family transcriptional regulator [Pseudoalteromonas fuliginea]
MSSLGIELKRLRANKKWTQAFAAREIGIQQSYLSKLENGQFIPSLDVLEKLSMCYEVSFESFIPINTKQNTSNNKLKWLIAFLLTLGVFMWLCASFNIFYSETYFTYQAKNGEFWAINVIETYKGEKYIEGDVIYEIIGQRDISRLENRILLVSSAVFIFGALLISMLINKPWLNKEK